MEHGDVTMLPLHVGDERRHVRRITLVERAHFRRIARGFDLPSELFVLDRTAFNIGVISVG